MKYLIKAMFSFIRYHVSLVGIETGNVKVGASS
jgi:hypothetical protein